MSWYLDACQDPLAQHNPYRLASSLRFYKYAMGIEWGNMEQLLRETFDRAKVPEQRRAVLGQRVKEIISTSGWVKANELPAPHLKRTPAVHPLLQKKKSTEINNGPVRVSQKFTGPHAEFWRDFFSNPLRTLEAFNMTKARNGDPTD